MSAEEITPEAWKAWLIAWNEELFDRIDPSLERRLQESGHSLQRYLDQFGVTPQIRASRWLGFPPATEAQITQLEQRLQRALPPTYRAFLRASNGFLQPLILGPRLLAAEEVRWLRDEDQKVIDTLPAEKLSNMLQIGGRGSIGAERYLLNPDFVSTKGEWQALRFCPPDSQTFRTLWELCQYNYWFSKLLCDRGDGVLGRADDIQTIFDKVPLLVKALDRKILVLREDPYIAPKPSNPQSLDVVQFAKKRVIEATQSARSAAALFRRLRSLWAEYAGHRPSEDGFMAVSESLHYFLNGRQQP